MRQPKISVIIPMYNCAEYVPQLFETMSNQTFKDFEVLCVIDGATDNTLEAVKECSAKDGRIRYLCKENGGAGSARNVGLDNVTGEYVICLDADDCYSESILEKMVAAAEKHRADVAVCLYYEKNLKTGVEKELGFNKDIFPEDVCINPKEVQSLYRSVTPGPTNKLYRRDFIEKYHLRYSTTMVANDVFFVYASMSAADRAVGVHEHLITVQKYSNTASITSNRGKHSEDVIRVFRDLYRWLQENGLAEYYLESFCNAVAVGIAYNAEFAVNPVFIEETVHMLNEEEPFAEMSPDQINDIFGNRFDIDFIEARIKELEENIAEGTTDPEGPDPEVVLFRTRIRRENMMKILMYSRLRYYRIFGQKRYADIKEAYIAQKMKNRRLRKKIMKLRSRMDRFSFRIAGFIDRLLHKSENS